MNRRAHAAAVQGMSDTITLMLGGTPAPPPAPDLWDEIVGIPLDEWMAANTTTKLRRAIWRRRLRELRRR